MQFSPPPPPRSRVLLGLAGGILAASTAAIFIRFAQSGGASSILIAAARLGIASLLLAPPALLKHHAALSGLSRRQWMLALLAGIFLALHFAAWITSLQYTSVASSVVLVTSTPLWVALLAPLLLGERFGKWTLAGLALALLGSSVVGLSDACVWQAGHLACPGLQGNLQGSILLGDFLALSGAWMAAGYILVGRRLRGRMDLLPYIFLVYGMAALVLAGAALLSGSRLAGLPPLVFLWFFLLALIPQLLGHTSFNWALKYLPASVVSVTLLGEPIGSILLAYLILGESPTLLKICGGAVILLGIWMSSQAPQDANA